MKAKETEMTYEDCNDFDNKIEKQYKHEKGYDKINTEVIDWYYTNEDRAECERRMKWENFQNKLRYLLRLDYQK